MARETTARGGLVLRNMPLLGVLALALAACGGDETQNVAEPEDGPETTPEEVEEEEPAPDYPTSDITILNGFGAGGGTDTVARMAAEFASEQWGVNIDVVSQPGGNTVPANLELRSAEPDGHTLMVHAIGSTSVLPNQLGDDLPFDVMDQTFLANISSNTMLFITSPDSPIDTLEDLAEQAREDPGDFTWSAIGVAEITMRQFFEDAGVNIEDTQSVVQEGSVDAIVLASQGDVDVAIAAVGPSLGPAEEGIIKPLAMAGDERWPDLPDVPTGEEAGFPSVRIISWIGLAGPPGLPDHVVTAWEDVIREMLDDPEIQERIDGFASVPHFMDSDEFTAQVDAEIEEFRSLYE